MSTLRTEYLLAITSTPPNRMDDRSSAIIDVASQLKKIGDELDCEGAANMADMQMMDKLITTTILTVGAVAVTGLLWRWVTTS